MLGTHYPKNAEKRRRGQSRGGKNKPSKELIDIKHRLLKLAGDVEEGIVETSVGAVVNQVLNSYLRAIQVGLKVKEVEELEARLEELEKTLGDKEHRQWG